jgi:hypothetical protein
LPNFEEANGEWAEFGRLLPRRLLALALPYAVAYPGAADGSRGLNAA